MNVLPLSEILQKLRYLPELLFVEVLQLGDFAAVQMPLQFSQVYAETDETVPDQKFPTLQLHHI
jgi:hypothetical protein